MPHRTADSDSDEGLTRLRPDPHHLTVPASGGSSGSLSGSSGPLRSLLGRSEDEEAAPAHRADFAVGPSDSSQPATDGEDVQRTENATVRTEIRYEYTQNPLEDASAFSAREGRHAAAQLLPPRGDVTVYLFGLHTGLRMPYTAFRLLSLTQEVAHIFRPTGTEQASGENSGWNTDRSGHATQASEEHDNAPTNRGRANGRTNGHTNGHANGHINGHDNGHAGSEGDVESGGYSE